MRWNKGFLLAAGLVLVCTLRPPSAGTKGRSGTGAGLSAIGQATVPSAQPQVPGQQSATPNSAAPTQQASPPAQLHSLPTFLVMIDPGHGGDDQGAVFRNKVVEKDVTLALARRLKSELQDRGIPAHLLRDSDTSVSLEQRAETANQQHASVYVALHVGSPGGGVRVYSPALASSSPPAAG